MPPRKRLFGAPGGVKRRRSFETHLPAFLAAIFASISFRSSKARFWPAATSASAFKRKNLRATFSELDSPPPLGK